MRKFALQHRQPRRDGWALSGHPTGQERMPPPPGLRCRTRIFRRSRTDSIPRGRMPATRSALPAPDPPCKAYPERDRGHVCMGRERHRQACGAWRHPPAARPWVRLARALATPRGLVDQGPDDARNATEMVASEEADLPRSRSRSPGRAPAPRRSATPNARSAAGRIAPRGCSDDPGTQTGKGLRIGHCAAGPGERDPSGPPGCRPVIWPNRSTPEAGAGLEVDKQQRHGHRFRCDRLSADVKRGEHIGGDVAGQLLPVRRARRIPLCRSSRPLQFRDPQQIGTSGTNFGDLSPKRSISPARRQAGHPWSAGNHRGPSSNRAPQEQRRLEPRWGSGCPATRSPDQAPGQVRHLSDRVRRGRTLRCRGRPILLQSR